MQECFKELQGKNFENTSSKEFEIIARDILSKNGFFIKRQFPVADRGDGKRGRIDFVCFKNFKTYAIEIDRKSPRKKSIFKLQVYGADESYLMTRSPFSIIRIME